MPPLGSTPRVSPLALAAACLPVAVVCLALALTPLRSSHDEWWHLKTGQYIDAHGLPENDVFSYTAEDVPWHNHEWLAQVLLWRVYRVGESLAGEVLPFGGVGLVVAFKATFLLAAYLALTVFVARRNGSAALAALAVVLAIGLARRTLYPRPPFITYGFLALLFMALLAWRDRRIPTPALALLAPFFALWANLHGGFMAGLALVGAFWLESLSGVWLARRRMEDPAAPRRRFRAMTLVAALCFLATLANPYTYHLYELPGRVLKDQALKGVIFEMLPADWRFVWIVDGCIVLMLFAAVRPRTRAGLLKTALGGAGLVLLMRGGGLFIGPEHAWRGALESWNLWFREAAALAIFAVAGARSKERVGLGATLSLLFFAHQGIQHVRFLPFLGVILAPIFAQTWADWIRGSVGTWDWMWTAPPEHRPPEAQEKLLESRRRRMGRCGAAAAALLAAFYLLWPGEAYNMIFPGKFRRAELLKAPNQLQRNLALLGGREMEPGAYPVEAVDFLEELKPPGRLFNGGNYAGYLIWRLSPEQYKVFTDNRYDIYGGAFLGYQNIVLTAFEGDRDRGIPSWETVLDRYDVHTLFIPVGVRLHEVLTQRSVFGDTPWRNVYSDRAFAIWVRPKETAHPQPPPASEEETGKLGGNALEYTDPRLRIPPLSSVTGY